MMPARRLEPNQDWACGGIALRSIPLAIRPFQALVAIPTTLFLASLTAMLLRPPDVSFYEIDRVAFGLLVFGVAGRALVSYRMPPIVNRATWPMIGLSSIALLSVIGGPSDTQTWSLLIAKFIVPFSLFHLAQLVFRKETSLRHFEWFSLLMLSYLSFTAIAFLVGARTLIFPRFILDESIGYHVDRARGPLLQAVANGVSLNLLGLLAVHSYLRKRLRGIGAFVLLGSLPVAILATMTRAVWLSFVISFAALLIRGNHPGLRRICGAAALMGACGVLLALSFGDQRRSLSERLRESGPVDFREAVYAAGWQMFLEKPLIGWGVNQMPAELARHVTGYSERELYPHNTYLELLVEHGILGLGLYGWLIWELFRLGRGRIPRAEREGLLNRGFHAVWPVLLGVYFMNALVVGMNYQFVNGLLFTIAGMLAAQQTRASREVQLQVNRRCDAIPSAS
jgi:O-antigen ligase